MPKRQVETTIGGVRYRLTQLGGNTLAELGDDVNESSILTRQGKPGLAASLQKLRGALITASAVLVVDEHDPNPNKKATWQPLATVFDDHFSGSRAADHPAWYSWALKQSGLQDFLGGGTRVPGMRPQDPSPSASPPAADTSPTDSSSPTG